MSLTRRQFCIVTATAITGGVMNFACNDFGPLNLASDGRLTVRQHAPKEASEPGKNSLFLDRDRDAILQIPNQSLKGPVPLLVMLHGATQSADDMFDYLGSTPEEAGVAVLAPNSRETTWDAISGNFSRDVGFINHAMDVAFDKVAIEALRVAIGGFSDGASYALSLGLINGDFFSRVIAFSPGFIIEGARHGRPRFFVSHGRKDHILPIDRCSRRIVADLRANGYDVTLREFDGDHEIPEDVAKEGLAVVAT